MGYRLEQLRQMLARGREQCKPRVMVVINPGNPTGQCLGGGGRRGRGGRR